MCSTRSAAINACEVPGDDPPYIAMERLGEALSGRIARGRLPLCVSLDLARRSRRR